MKKIRIPNTLVLIFWIMALMAALTYLIPGGQYERITVNGRKLLDPASYQSVPHVPQGLFALLMAPLKGFVQAANIIGFIFIVGGAFFVIQETGALEALINKISRLHARSRLMRVLFIPITITIFSVFGSVFGMSEEVIAFILLFVPLAVSLGYDSIVGVSLPFVGAGAGFAGAFLNPFTVGIAQGIAELPPFSGFGYRFVVWLVVTAIAIGFVAFYAHRIRRNPERSPVYRIDEYWRAGRHLQDQQPQTATMTKRHALILIIFALAMVGLILGVTLFGWYIDEIAALFLGTALLIGLVSHLSIDQITKTFVRGAGELMTVAFIIAMARAILVIASDGRIIDSILHSLAGVFTGTHPVFAAQLMFVVQSVINVFIPSGSGQAALVMPVMSPLSDLLHVSRQTAVLAFQLGDGLTNLIIPTSGVTMGVLGLARIPYVKWFRWMLPLQIIFFVAALLLLIPPVLLSWGPF
ncbi:MAG TPA: putative basic amino acid antiporter YfcC [Caldithrix abyssi]|uniref:Basic amino acid antiporter YfcC n=1 Tax=Caldithrix abyssi TaxID=187145 RepID=A0A7V5UEN6_CALAY|nr:putative basic amino acid antiporter YfcC [Caldithrix abyssi]